MINSEYNNEFLDIYQNPFFKGMTYNMTFAIFARDKEDFAYRIKTLKKIVKSVDGGLVLSGHTPQKIYWMAKTARCVAKAIGWKNVIKSIPGLMRLMKSFIKRFGMRGLDYLNCMMYEALIRQGMQGAPEHGIGGVHHHLFTTLRVFELDVPYGRQVLFATIAHLDCYDIVPASRN